MTEIFPFTISGVQERIHDWAIEKGWLNPDQPRDGIHLAGLLTEEIGELVTAFRTDPHKQCDKTTCEYLSCLEEEIADIIIRTIQMADEHGVDVLQAVRIKMEYNETRPYKHGKKA